MCEYLDLLSPRYDEPKLSPLSENRNTPKLSVPTNIPPDSIEIPASIVRELTWVQVLQESLERNRALTLPIRTSQKYISIQTQSESINTNE